MKEFQPMFLENLRISIPRFSILRFAHHRHSEKSDQITEHEHRYSQFLLYLRGQGIQTTQSVLYPVRRGSFLYFPPKTRHGFKKVNKASPFSVVINFKEKKQTYEMAQFKALSPTNLTEIESTLNQMVGSVDLGNSNSISIASGILNLFSLLFQVLTDDPSSTRQVHPVTGMVRKALAQLNQIPHRPSEIARFMKEDLSSLNRKIRHETGLNVGTLLDENRQKRAFEGLQKKEASISQIALDCGFRDPNYFARWFRNKVGQSPRQWRNGNFV